jgi:uncharacterized protein YllA (UPF0747 family)
MEFDQLDLTKRVKIAENLHICLTDLIDQTFPGLVNQKGATWIDVYFEALQHVLGRAIHKCLRHPDFLQGNVDDFIHRVMDDILSCVVMYQDAEKKNLN